MADFVTQAFFDAMAASSALTSQLSVFGGAPAIFTAKTIPPDAKRPYVWSYAEASQAPFDDKTQEGRELVRDIWAVADDDGSEALVAEIAEEVRAVFHRLPLDFGPGRTGMLTDASGPRLASTSDGVTARIVTVRAIYQVN
jgi:hypothetical protein